MRRINLATRITLVRMVFIPVFLVVLLGRMPSWGPWLAAAVFTLLAATDGVDGYIARSRNQVTTFGKFVDPLADKLLVAAALIALVELGKIGSWIAIVIISRELIVSGLRMVAIAEGKVVAASSWGKVKTVLQIVAVVLYILRDSTGDLILWDWDVIELVQAVAPYVMGAAILLTLVSMIEYFYHARDVLTGPWSEGEPS
jgi:CDP-diacylglycerol--glycerol-3-phosphate 3-phosphatidyltransferase